MCWIFRIIRYQTETALISQDWDSNVYIECAVTANCSIDVLAYSAPGCNSGHVTLNGDVVWQGSFPCGNYHHNPRGVNTLLIDPFSCSVQENRTFDTYSSSHASSQLSNYLHHVNHGRVIVGVSADEPTWRLTSSARSTMQGLGADVEDVRYRGSFAFIAQKGYPSKTALRKVPSESESSRSPAHVNAFISGTQRSIRNAVMYLSLLFRNKIM